jgi:transcriptional regulator with XRE-family HTH domain
VALGLGVRDVAAELGLDHRNLGRFERGERAVSMDIQTRLCRVLGRAVDELFAPLPVSAPALRRDGIAAAYLAGETASELARRFEVSVNVVYDDLKAKQVESRPRDYKAEFAHLRGVARPAHVQRALRAAQNARSEAVVAEITRGGCGTAGCEDANCCVTYGRCHCGCGQPAGIARQSDRRRSYVRGEPTLLAPRHLLSVSARDGGAALRAERVRLGLSTADVAVAAKLNGNSVISQLEGRWGYRIRRSAAEAVIAALQRAGSAAPFAEIFTSERPPAALTGTRSQAELPHGDGAHFRAAARTARAYAEAHGFVNRAEAAEIVRVAPSMITRLVDRGLLVPVEANHGLLGHMFFRPADLEAARTELNRRWRTDERARRLVKTQASRRGAKARKRWGGRLAGYDTTDERIRELGHRNGRRPNRPSTIDAGDRDDEFWAEYDRQVERVLKLKADHPTWGPVAISRAHVREGDIRVGIALDVEQIKYLLRKHRAILEEAA